MKRDQLTDLAAFAVVAREASFTRAAARLSMSPSALSHAMKALEARLGVQLLARTTRSVATTDAGERLLQTLRPALDDIQSGLDALGGLREGAAAGTVRITAPRHAATSVLWPTLPGFQAAHPDIRVEVSIDDRPVDIVSDRFDAGVRFGENIARDMVATRIGPDLRAAVVAAPAYLSGHAAPVKPEDLSAHRCINYRFASGALYAWEFEDSGRAFSMRVDGGLVVDDGDLIVAAARAGQGVAYAWEDTVADDIASGRLVRLLEPWCVTFPGYYLYTASRRQAAPALRALIDALRIDDA